MRRAAYIIALLGAGLWYLTFGQWLAWIFLLGLLILPLLSLALSMKAILDFQLAPIGPERGAVGEKTELMLMGSCGSPMPPFKGKIRLRNLRTGEKIVYREETGFTPAHCGGYEMTVEKGRGRGWLTPSTVTCPSSMASKRADWVREVARFSSSARNRLHRMPPGRYTILPVPSGTL